MSKILLPPLPPQDRYDYAGQMRARDLEVARVVLESALKPFRSSAEYPNGMTKDAAERFIRALEVGHHE